LINLLNNSADAIGAHHEKWIKLTALAVDDGLRITIVDSGKGIPLAHQSKLFTANFTTKSLNQGTGFGLSISRKIAEQHLGTLRLDLENPNTCFVLELPWKQSEALVKMARAV
jgi:two-component system sensor histidine kinase HupT/HoxJ